jgi:ferredoxin-type protein NapF
MDLARRSFLFGHAATAPTLRPPWSRHNSVLEACSGCGECVDACPVGIIVLEAGGLAEINLAHHECTFCGECAQACPEDVFDTALQAFDHEARFGEECLAQSGIECRACQDACPESAIRFRPRLGGPAVPELSKADCTGCGACIAPCPTGTIEMASPILEDAHG